MKTKLLRFAFHLLYHQLAWSYDLVSWLVSLGAWRSWQRATLPFVQGSRILEIGHGPGHMLLELANMGHEVVGLDLSRQMLGQAQRRLWQQGLSAPLIWGKLPNLPLAPNQFDSVLATFPTDFIMQPTTLTAVYRTLKPNGRFIILPEAQLSGTSWLHRAIDWLFVITNQRNPHASPTNLAQWEPWETALKTADFHPQIHLIELANSRATVIVATKLPTPRPHSAKIDAMDENLNIEPETFPAEALIENEPAETVDNVEQEAETAVSPPHALPEEPATLGQRLIMFIIMAVVLGIDQWTKNIIETTLRLGEVYAPFPDIEPFFRIFHVSNTGAAFGLLPSGGPIFGFLAVVVSLFIIYYNHTLPKGQLGFRIVLGLLLGGALGNFIDRVRLGHVTDFLDFGPWPVFNVADMSVVAGVIILGWFTYQEYRLEQELARQAAAEPTAVEPNPIDEWSTS